MAWKSKNNAKNWIGKSYGAIIKFSLENSCEKISVFTTRPDTIFGATFIAYHLNIHLQRKFLTKIKSSWLYKILREKFNQRSWFRKTEKYGYNTNLSVSHPLKKMLS